MKFQTEVKQVLGTPDQGAWSQAHHFVPNQKEKLDKRGELVLLVSLGDIAKNQSPAGIGREIISRFHEEYYGSLTEKPMAALEKATAKVAEEKSQYFDQPEEIILISLVLWKNIAYLSIYHQGKILLRRESETVKLLEANGDQPVSASGFVRLGDIFLLGTADFFSQLPETMLPSALSTENLDRMVEILAPVVHAREEQGRLAVVMVKISQGQKQSQISQVIKKNDLKFLTKLNLTPVFKFIRTKISTLTVAIGFLILLSLSVFFGWRKRIKQQNKAKVNDLTTQVEEKLSNAAAVRNLDPEGSLDLVNQAEEISKQLAKLDKAKAENYQQRMDELRQNLGEKPLEPKMYYNLHLVGENIEVGEVYSDGQSALVFDRQEKRIISLNLSKRSAEIVVGDENISGEALIVSTKDRIYFVKNSVYWVEDEELDKLLDLSEEFNPVAAAGWLGSLYLLDPSQKEIWKFPAITDGIGKQRSWLKSKTGLDFSTLVDMAIDGNIWLLSDNGKVYKYLSGQKEQFDQQLPSGIGQAEYLAVASEAERFGFWDSKNKTVWVFSKQGSFIARQPVNLDKVHGIAISPDGTKVYLFGLDKIYLLQFNAAE